MPHVLLQRTRLVNGEVSGSWAVSVYTVKAFLWAITKESPMLTDVGALGVVFHHSVARLTADMAADIIRRATALIGRV